MDALGAFFKRLVKYAAHPGVLRTGPGKGPGARLPFDELAERKSVSTH